MHPQIDHDLIVKGYKERIAELEQDIADMDKENDRLLQENERLREIVQAIRKTIWLERAADMIDDGRPYDSEYAEEILNV
jgi:regulator of replication initiation timing